RLHKTILGQRQIAFGTDLEKFTSMNLPPDLEGIREKIEGYARDFGLDFYETIFEILDFKQLNEVASFMGFPNRFPHWRFGMEYERLSKSYAYGLHKIYEI